MLEGLVYLHINWFHSSFAAKATFGSMMPLAKIQDPTSMMVQHLGGKPSACLLSNTNVATAKHNSVQNQTPRMGTKKTKSTLKTGKIFRTRPKKPSPRPRYAHTLCSQPLKPSPRSPSQSETGGCRVETFEASTQCCKVCYISCCHFKYHDDCCYCCYQCGCDRFHFHLEVRISLWLH